MCDCVTDTDIYHCVLQEWTANAETQYVCPAKRQINVTKLIRIPSISYSAIGIKC